VLQRELKRIAALIRAWREEAGLTLQELGDRSGVSASTIHKIENNHSVPTIAVVLKLAHGLDRRPHELFEKGQAAVGVSITRLAERGVLETQPGTQLARVAGHIPGAIIDLWRVTHESGEGTGHDADAKRLQYRGELIVVVEEGEFCFEIGEDKFCLAEGDSLHFKTSTPHLWYNQGNTPASALFFGLQPGVMKKIAGKT
jgi:transcriptional regulator with XRE-family HTH domain